MEHDNVRERTNPDDAARFLSQLHGDAQNFCIWKLQDKTAYWFSDTEDAARFVVDSSDNCDIYTSVGHFHERPRRGRGKASEVSAIPGLWSDVDYGQSGYPDDIDAALEVIRQIGPQPSLIIHSGHGLQAWWLLHEPLDISDQVAQLLKRWNATLQTAAHVVGGWALDSVHDLARVMRVPGTYNNKHAPLPVYLYTENEVRYTTDDIDVYLVEGAPPRGRERERVTIGMVQPGRQDAPTVLRNLLDMGDTQIIELWERRRHDLPDQSGSGYDLAIANACVSRGFTDQEIADTISAWRLRHGEQPEKARRRDYLQRTIGLARSGARQDDAEVTEERSTDPDVVREGLSEVLGRPFSRFVKLDGENPEYYIEWTDGSRTHLGTAQQVLSPSKVLEAFFRDGYVLPQAAKRYWRQRYVGQLLAIQEVVGQAEDRVEDRLFACLDDYLGNRALYDGEYWEEGVEQNQPVLYQGQLGINLRDLRRWMAAMGERGERLGYELVKLGFARCSLPNPRRGGTKVYYLIHINQVMELLPESVTRNRTNTRAV